MRRLVFDIGPLEGGTVLVAGSARSGTTWVAEHVAKVLGARLIFEPFVVDERGLPAVLDRSLWRKRALRLEYSHYLGDTATNGPWSDALERILSGSVTRDWGMLPVAPGIYRRRVIKAIRANLLLAHLARRWPGVPILWLQRHPLEVVNSQLRMRHEKGWEFDWMPASVTGQEALMKQWLEPFEEQIRGASSLVERLACRWCVENYVPQRLVKTAPNVLRLSFHALRTEAAPWESISELLGKLVPGLDAELDGRGAPPSFTAGRPAGEIGDPALDHLSPGEQDEVMRVVSRFGLEELALALRRT